jgi:hypothetical protein
MHEFYQFMGEHTFLAFISIYYVIKMPFTLTNRYIRSRNIRARGWPPAHLDADGDFNTNTDSSGQVRP